MTYYLYTTEYGLSMWVTIDERSANYIIEHTDPDDLDIDITGWTTWISLKSQD